MTIARPDEAGFRAERGQQATGSLPDARAATRRARAEGLKYTSTETEAATDCRYLDYDSNPAISAEVAAERGEHNPHKATKTN